MAYCGGGFLVKRVFFHVKVDVLRMEIFKMYADFIGLLLLLLLLF